MAHEHDDLERAFRKLRRVQAPARFAARLHDALEQADQRRLRDTERLRASLVRHALLALPGLASVVIASHVLLVDAGFDVSRVAEQAVELDGRDAAPVHIGLTFDAHASAPASVRLEVPHGLELAALADGRDLGEAPSCNLRGCIYEFTRRTEGEPQPIELRVTSPGRYRLEAEHVSDLKRVHEVFLIHAH